MKHFLKTEKAISTISALWAKCEGKQAGVSIIEILIAITIFAIGIMAVVKMQTAAVRSNTYSSNLTRAVIDYNQKKQSICWD